MSSVAPPSCPDLVWTQLLSTEALPEAVGVALSVPRSRVLGCRATPIVGGHALTTFGRYAVTGSVLGGCGARQFRLFLKVIQSFGRSPLPLVVTPQVLASIEAAGGWDVEATVYRSALGSQLPDGLRMVPAVSVRPLDSESVAVWLEWVDDPREGWDAGRYARAAELIGRFAVAPASAEAVGPIRSLRDPELLAEHWLTPVVLPALRGDLWEHPLLRGTFDAKLRERIVAAADALPELLAAISAVPVVVAHGDACPANLPVDGDGFVLLDFGFAGRAPLGLDLVQLTTAEILNGTRSVAELPELSEVCRTAYLAAVQSQVDGVDASVFERAHDALLVILAGLLAVPFEHLDEPITQELTDRVRAHAAVATFALDRWERHAG